MKAKIYKYDYSTWPYAEWFKTLTGEPKINDNHKYVSKVLVQECSVENSGNRYTLKTEGLPRNESLHVSFKELNTGSN